MHGGGSRREADPDAAAATVASAADSSLLGEAEEFDVWIGTIEAPMASTTLDALQYPHDAEFVRVFWSQFDPGPSEPSDDDAGVN